jgi:hypothetical protein
MSSRDCVFKCGTLLGEYDQNARKYHELESGQIHTRERCEAAKAKLAQKNDHGNEDISTRPIALSTQPNIGESSGPTAIYKEAKELEAGRLEAPPNVDHTVRPKGYLDHTLAGIPQIITVVADSPEEMDDLANSWLRNHHKVIKFKGGQRVLSEDQYEITLYYEQL